MKRKFVIDPFDAGGIDEAIAGLEEYQRWLNEKSEELCSRLATLGATKASLGFSRAIYNGIKDATITVEGDGLHYTVRADGESVLFLEFGSGIKYGAGHPAAGQYGMGPGTYPIPPGKGHWDDENGWYLPKEKGGGHSFGNPPSAAMYDAVKLLEQELPRIVQEVFAD